FTAVDAAGTVRFADFGELDTPFPFVALMPQSDFLRLVFKEAERTGHVRLVTGADVQGLIGEAGTVRGVRYDWAGEHRELRAPLVVACDGRHSAVRAAAGLEPAAFGASIDVLWTTLPRCPGDDAEAGALFRFGPGAMLALMPAADHWQAGLIIEKGSFEAVQAAGIEAFRERLAALAPAFAGRVDAVESWRQVALLRVEVARLRRWYRPGVLCIGDAAHAMSPVGMVGINLAIQDAVAAAEVLAGPLRQGAVPERLLRAVQHRRQRWIRLAQRVQAVVHRRVLGRALSASVAPRLPQPERWLMQRPVLRHLATRLIAYGYLGRG
ncbi:MAG: FAD-dependent monooxygenase, partial [Rhodothermales bacterium]|nr:FAD-dependent monooxygenase [Rhodothermales bacterium]